MFIFSGDVVYIFNVEEDEEDNVSGNLNMC